MACGQILEARISGPDADTARDVLAGLATQNYGEDLKPRAARTSEAGSGHPGRAAAVRAFGDVPAAAERRAVMAPVTQVGLRPPVGDYRPLTPKDELARSTGPCQRSTSSWTASSPAAKRCRASSRLSG